VDVANIDRIQQQSEKVASVVAPAPEASTQNATHRAYHHVAAAAEAASHVM
jgi:hypothetical protein